MRNCHKRWLGDWVGVVHDSAAYVSRRLRQPIRRFRLDGAECVARFLEPGQAFLTLTTIFMRSLQRVGSADCRSAVAPVGATARAQIWSIRPLKISWWIG